MELHRTRASQSTGNDGDHLSAAVIPKTLHFCFGLSPNGGNWGLVHYACVKSAVERIKPERAFLYFEYQPSGPFWNLTTRLVDCRKITAPRTVFGNPLLHYAHRADVVRLQTLIETGGIYLDCDVLVHRDFDDLLGHSVVLGREGEDETVGLCNAVILAEPDAPFLKRWYSRYHNFRSKGHDLYWNEHSVLLPLKIAHDHPEELTIVGPRAFFWPSFDKDGLKRIFASGEPLPSEGVYAHHLWESLAWSDYLRDLTPARVRTVESNFHRWVRPLIADLSDDFGANSLASRVIDRIGTDQLPNRQGNSRLRRIKAALRNSHPLVDRVVGNRHRYVDRGLGVVASLAAKGLGRYADPIAALHRRRTFQSIYRHYHWGEDRNSPFFSGIGSRGEHASAYVEAMVPLLARHVGETAKKLVVVDLGCGDFTIGAGLLKLLERVHYIGCDIVAALIDYNQYRHGRDGVEFRRIDMVRDPLPDGDVCLLRQVLQHLSNAEIAAILPKLKKYRALYVSEGQPSVLEGLPNPDKPVGEGVRYDWQTGRGRGVELDLPPWNLSLREIVRTSGAGAAGFIVTYRVGFPDRGSAGAGDALERSDPCPAPGRDTERSIS